MRLRLVFTMGWFGLCAIGCKACANTVNRSSDSPYTASTGEPLATTGQWSAPAEIQTAPMPVDSAAVGPSALAAILPADRITEWKPGIPGGIPARTKTCAVLGPTGFDDTAGIQTALDTCPPDHVVLLKPGDYKIDKEGLSITRSRVTLRGSGPSTRLLKPPGTNYPVIIIGKRWFKYISPIDLASDAVRGSRTAKLSRPERLNPGELVVVNALTDPAKTVWSERSPPGDPSRGWFAEYERPVGQTLEVQSVQGTEVTFTTAFHSDFTTARAAHLLRIDNMPSPPVAYSGIEDLFVSGGEGGDGGGNIHLFACAYSWVKNVESVYSDGHSVNLDGTFRSEIRDSYIHSSKNPNPGGGGYGVGVNSYGSDNLIENNIVWAFNKVIVMRASGGGNVVGYNYMEDGFGAGYPTIPEVGLNASHMTTPHYELFEGNQSWNFAGDAVWGNSIYITALRNHLTGKRRSAAPLQLKDEVLRRIVESVPGHRWYSFLGNVLGYPDQVPSPGGERFAYEVIGDTPDGVVPVWKLAPDTLPTLLRHGNFDFFTGQTRWDPSIKSRKLPVSAYLASKPAFFGDLPWPWVTPENPQHPLGRLPARVRFDKLHPDK